MESDQSDIFDLIKYKNCFTLATMKIRIKKNGLGNVKRFQCNFTCSLCYPKTLMLAIILLILNELYSYLDTTTYGQDLQVDQT
jgi:hypothetical protein